MAADKGSRESVEDLERQANLVENYDRASSAYSEAADRVNSMSYEQREDMNGAFFDHLRERGMSVAQIGELMNNRGTREQIRAKSAQLESLRNEFTEQYIEDNINPKIGGNFSQELPAPNDPGAPVAPGGDVFNPVPTVRRQYNDQWMDTNKT